MSSNNAEGNQLEEFIEDLKDLFFGDDPPPPDLETDSSIATPGVDEEANLNTADDDFSSNADLDDPPPPDLETDSSIATPGIDEMIRHRLI